MLNPQHSAVVDEPDSHEQLPEVLHLKAIIASHHGITIQSNDQLQVFRILHLRPTNDFYTPLLSRGPNIKVLEPEWLVEEIKDQVAQVVELYK